jgi:hypothetical protein
MNTKRAALGVVILVIIIVAILVARDLLRPKTVISPTSTPTIEQTSSKFNGLTIPLGATTADLKNVAGGQSTGIAFFEKTNGTYTYTVAAELPAPSSGSYQAYLTDGKTNILMGTLTVGKGGYIVNYSSTKDLSNYKTVFVNLGTKRILEGSFQ